MSKSEQLEKCKRLKEKIQIKIAKEKECCGIEEKLSLLNNNFLQEIKKAVFDSQVKLNEDLFKKVK